MKIDVLVKQFLAGKEPHTRRRYLSALSEFKTNFPMTEAGACDYVASLYDAGKSDATIKNSYSALHAIWTFLVEMRQAKHNIFDPAKRVISWRQNNQVRPTKLIPFNDVLAVIDSIKPVNKGIRDRAVLAILFGCGLRRSELQVLRLRSIMIDHASNQLFLRIQKAKSGEGRDQPIPDWAQPYIGNAIRYAKSIGLSDDDYLITSNYGKKALKEPIHERTLNRIFQKYFKAGPHAARATFATKLLEQGIEYSEVARALGHRHTGQVAKYDKRFRGLSNNAGRLITY